MSVVKWCVKSGAMRLFIMFFALSLGGACSGLGRRMMTPKEQDAIDRANAVRIGMTDKEVQDRLGRPSYIIRRHGDGKEMVLVTENNEEVVMESTTAQYTYGCRSWAYRRGAGVRMWSYDLLPSVRVCVYFDNSEVVAESRVRWH